MLESNFLDLINDNYYMICIFDENKNVVSKNKKFNIFFQKLNNYADFEKNFIEYDDSGVSSTAYIKSPDFDGIMKFELSKSEGNILAIGTKINYDKVMSMLKMVESKYEDEDEIKSINFNKNKLKPYCTFMVDDLWTVKYFSDNIYSLLNIKNPYLKSVSDVFGKEFFEKINEQLDYLDIFNDLCIEYDDKLVVMTKSQYGYTIINIYPYSNNVCNKFEEVTRLKYQIEKLENELERRKKLIDLQKDMIKDLSTKIG